MRTVKRDSTKVRFLELFFDLVFVLAFTQCTALMVEHPTGEGIVQGLFALALLWWAWGGYTWAASVVDPEEGATRFIIFGSMAGLIVVALAIPGAFGDQGLTFALAYAVVRYAHLALFVLASRDDPNLRSSVVSLAASSTVGLGILIWASFLDGVPQLVVWALALVIDFGGPAIYGVAGWKLVPAHFAERYGLIIILALGESIVVIGAGAHGHVTGGVITAAVFGVLLSSALWWTYFDVVAIVTERRLTQATPGREQNSFARDSYTYLHLPMAAGIILVAMGLENTVAHVDEPLKTVPAYALTAGVALYLLAHVGLRLRNAHSISYPRLVVAAVLVGATPIATEISALTTLVAINVVVWAMIAYETKIYGHTRGRVRSHH
jgi:low temperature requirement protein LtrA